MTTHKLIMGLTDIRDEESFIFDENHIETHDANGKEFRNIRYNLFKQTPEIEKETLEWTFHTERPLVANLLKLWETVIRKPHLKMVNHRMYSHYYSPADIFNNLNVSFINLLPADNWVNFEEEDYAYIQQHDQPEFGSIVIRDGDMLVGRNKRLYHDVINRSEMLRYAIDNKTTKFLTSFDNELHERAASPTFDFNLTEFFSKGEQLGYSASQLVWLKENEDELAELGYTIDNPKNKIGTYTLASMDTPAEKAHEIINKYNYVCRFSIVEED